MLFLLETPTLALVRRRLPPTVATVERRARSSPDRRGRARHSSVAIARAGRHGIDRFGGDRRSARITRARREAVHREERSLCRRDGLSTRSRPGVPGAPGSHRGCRSSATSRRLRAWISVDAASIGSASPLRPASRPVTASPHAARRIGAVAPVSGAHTPAVVLDPHATGASQVVRPTSRQAGATVTVRDVPADARVSRRRVCDTGGRPYAVVRRTRRRGGAGRGLAGCARPRGVACACCAR